MIAPLSSTNILTLSHTSVFCTGAGRWFRLAVTHHEESDEGLRLGHPGVTKVRIDPALGMTCNKRSSEMSSVVQVVPRSMLASVIWGGSGAQYLFLESCNRSEHITTFKCW